MQAFKKFSGHGTIPVIIGAAMAAIGHSQMFVRSLAVVLCAIWISLDVGVWISATEWQKQYKPTVFCVASCLLCCLAMGTMYWFLISTLEDQQIDVYDKLDPTVELPPSGEWTQSTFTVSNRGGTAIGNHQIYCGFNLIVLGLGNVIGGGELRTVPASDFPILPGGDAQSETCLAQSIRGVGAKPACLDISLAISYVLETQPSISKQKKFRFVFDESGDSQWHRQPLEMPTSPCSKHLRSR